MHSLEHLDARLADVRRLWLFLDYDGTLADFAPTPAEARADPQIVDLLARLNAHSRLRVGVVSGRGLPQLQVLVPVAGIVLAGTYGIELQTRAGEIVHRADYDTIRPPLDTLKPLWAGLIAEHEGFFLEDKGWALALHARFAAEDMAGKLLDQAQSAASRLVADSPLFRVIRDDKFLEVCPTVSDKGQAVRYLLEHDPWAGAVPLYAGDDARDEQAFEAINAAGGISLRVAAAPGETLADYMLDSPQTLRRWLETLMI